MLTHEELMEKCQKVRYAVDALLNVMRVDDYIYKPDLSAHDYIMDKLIYNEESLLSEYLENRDSISDADAKEIVCTLMIASNVEGYALGTEESVPEGRMINIKWNKEE